MTIEQFYYLWVVLLLLGNLIAWASNFFALPGNWLVLVLSTLFMVFVPTGNGPGIGLTAIVIVTVLAVLGEVIEFAAGAAGAARQGGSFRATVLALVGTVAGSIAGAVVGVPVPFIGPIIGAVGGGALGAFAGAYVGESWKGKTSAESIAVGKGAVIGRLLGTAGKLAVGAVMVVVVTIDSFIK